MKFKLEFEGDPYLPPEKRKKSIVSHITGETIPLNEYENNAEKNVMYGVEYPFIPEVANSEGVIFRENEQVLFYSLNDEKICAGVIAKIYNKNFVDIFFYRRYRNKNQLSGIILNVDRLSKYDGISLTPPSPFTEVLNQKSIFNEFSFLLDIAYDGVYGVDFMKQTTIDDMRLKDLERMRIEYLNKLC